MLNVLNCLFYGSLRVEISNEHAPSVNNYVDFKINKSHKNLLRLIPRPPPPSLPPKKKRKEKKRDIEVIVV